MPSETEIKRDEIYVFRSDYYHLKALNFLLEEKNYRDKAVIGFMKKFKIDINSYVPIKNTNGVYVPIIYKCMLHKKCEKTVKYLLDKGANIFLLPDADNIIELPFVCDRYYLNFLKIKKLYLQCSEENTLEQIIEKILKGDIKRIYDLQVLKFLQPNLIVKAINDKNLTNKIVINLLNAVAVICNTTNEKSHVDAEIKKYNNTIKFLLNNGHDIDDLQMQNIVNMYLVETAKMVKEHYIDKKWNITVTKHKNMDKYKTAYLRQLFNDYNENQLMLMFTSFTSFTFS